MIKGAGGVNDVDDFHKMTKFVHRKWNARSLSQVVRRANELAMEAAKDDVDNGKGTGKRKAAAIIMAAGLSGKGLKARVDGTGEGTYRASGVAHRVIALI